MANRLGPVPDPLRGRAETFDPDELALLAYWMRERDRIRALKESGARRPWTSDLIMRDNRWCNVRRMDDKVSRAMLRDWYRHDADPTTALTAACLGRLINWPASLVAITGGATFDLEHVNGAEHALERMQARGDKVFTAAYVVPGRPGESKIRTVVDHARWVALHARELYRPTMKDTWSQFTRREGIGSFLAGQMVADLAHLEAGECWADRETWAPLGPGSKRGMNRLLGRPKDTALTQDHFEYLLHELIEVLRPMVADLWVNRSLIAFDVQNVCCEVDKFLRLLRHEGKVRSSYPGASEQGLLI